MNSNNYFIKLLMISTNEDDYLLLYGFCTATNQETYGWRQHIVPKTGQCIWKAILTEDECNDFLNKLIQSDRILIGEKSFSSPQLFKRSMVLFNDGLNENSGPIDKFRKLTEFWNINKTDLFNKVVQCIGKDGKELYQDIKQIFGWVKKESGIDFIKNGYRLGNFEYYHSSIHEDDFEIEVHKEYGLLKTTVTKKCEFSNMLIVNCISEHRERTICNKTKLFLPEEHTVEFDAEEPMSKVVIQIWDEASGELIFSYNGILMMSLSIDMNLGGASYVMRDPWSQNLLKAASNRSSDIKNHIELVVPTSKYDTISMKSEYANEIDAAIKEGYELFVSYPRSIARGAFIENIQKDGEIESFIKIREYIEESAVKHVIIADPYFSTTAAAKILARISRSDIQVEVITSLVNRNPDTGNTGDVNEGERLQKFLETNSTLFSSNILVCNLKRGGAQVFHDRYLIRYFEDGRIDGFLLSNSLNSMGQFYPFVIAPLEYEVCLEVSSYLESMRDPDVQSKVGKSQRISCDILFDSRNNKNVHQPKIVERDFLPEWLSQWWNKDNELRIPEHDIYEAVMEVMKHWNDDNNLACRILCNILSAVNSCSTHIVIDAIRNISDLKELFVEKFILLAEEIERTRNHMKKGKYSQEYILWMLLKERTLPSRSGFHKITERPGHVWYDTDGWIGFGYILLLWVSPKKYMDLLESTDSPKMLDSLVCQLLYFDWTKEMFCEIVERGSLCIQLIGADCIFGKLAMGRLTSDGVKDILNQLSCEKRLIQAVRLLSRISVYNRTRTNSRKEQEMEQWDMLESWLMDSVVTDIAKCKSEIQDTAIYWLNDCEPIAKCMLHFKLVYRISDYLIKNLLLDEIISTTRKELLDCSYERDMSKIILLYLEAINERYGQDSEKEIFKQIINWSVFETATEPELKNYDYNRWHKAMIGAKRQLELLNAYLEMNPDAVKTKKTLNIWEKRVECSD